MNSNMKNNIELTAIVPFVVKRGSTGNSTKQRALATETDQSKQLIMLWYLGGARSVNNDCLARLT